MSVRCVRLAAALVLVLPAPAQDAVVRARERLAQTRAASGVPGLTAAVFAHGKVVFSEGAGFANLELETPATAATVYRVASISKAISAVGVMQLVEQGRVGLDDPIQRFVPSFPVKPEGAVTVRHLLTHTSGIRHYRNQAEVHETRAFPTLADAITLFKDDPLKHVPGTAFVYTTYGFNLLQGVLEQAGKDSLEGCLRSRVWGPAGMTSTALESASRIVRFRADGYRRDADGKVVNVPFTDVSMKFVGGGILSTAEDLVRLCAALDAGKLLKAESLREMQRIHFPLAGGTGRGLGWVVATDAAGRRQVSHSGSAVGFMSMLLHYPDQGVAVAVITNGEWLFPGKLAQELAELFLSAPGS